mgnify:CR=1 FL=1
MVVCKNIHIVYAINLHTKNFLKIDLESHPRHKNKHSNVHVFMTSTNGLVVGW